MSVSMVNIKETLLEISFKEKSENYLTEVESRTQGSRPRPRTQKNPRPRPRTATPRTHLLEAKDRNARGQGRRTQPQVFSKKQRSSKSFSGNLQLIGVARSFWLGRPKRKSYAITSLKICLLALNQDFAKGEGLN